MKTGPFFVLSVSAALLPAAVRADAPAPVPVAESPPPVSGAAPDRFTLAEVFAAVRTRHPALVAADASAEAARARIDQEKAWADPRLTLSANRAETGLAAETTDPTKVNEFEVTLAQEIPLGGRPRLRARAAAAEAGVASAEARLREWMLLNEVRLAFLRLAADDERLAVNARLHENLDQTLLLSQLAYESGLRPQSELLALEADRARLDADRTGLEGRRAQEAALLNALMLRPADAAIPALALPDPAAPVLALDAAVARARELSPGISVSLHEADAARARLAVVRKNRVPDPELSLTARRMRGSGDVVGSYDTAISFSLPWIQPGRTRAELAEARARVAAAQAETAAGEAEIAGLVASAHTRVATTFAEAARYRDELVPLARASAEAVRRDYEAGRAPLVAVLAAQRLGLESEEKFAGLRAENALAAAELTFLSGQDAQP